ncbi:hypothetical protein GGU10DRAFT_367180, partial [Lentinula aff. detonsa]
DRLKHLGSVPGRSKYAEHRNGVVAFTFHTMVHSRSVITAVFAVGAASSAIAIPLPSSGVAAGGSTRITSNVLVTPDSTGPPAPASTVTVKPSGNDPFASAGIDTQKLNSRELDIIVGYENEPVSIMFFSPHMRAKFPLPIHSFIIWESIITMFMFMTRRRR